MKEKAKFIVLEGMDGSGKTTQASLLKHYFERQNQLVQQAREPGGTEIGEEIRTILLKDRTSLTDPYTQTILFYAARREFMIEVIKPALEKGVNVISDRFEASTYVYQGLVQGVSLGLLASLHKYIAEDSCSGKVYRPDLVLVLDITIEESVQRIARGDRKGQELIYEKQGRNFLEKVRKGYQDYVQAFQGSQGGFYKTKVLLINGMKSEQEVHQDIIDEVERV